MKKGARRYAALALSAMLAVSGMGNLQKAEAAGVRMVRDGDLQNVEVEAPEAWGATPNAEQLHYMKSGLAVFCHFGPNTYNNIEWGENYGTREPSDIFGLREGFDAEGLVKAVKEAGFSRIILTAKHHDGLCLWDTETTTYNICEAGYQGDILEELSDACTKYNLDMGCYLSPWDIHEDKYGCFGDNNNRENTGGYTDYNKLYIDSIKEICTAKKEDGSYKYGNRNPNRRSDAFVEWWMDGAQGNANNEQTFDWKGILGEIRKWNPSCQVFGTHAAINGKNGKEDIALASTGGIHWIGNEEGKASTTTWAKVTAGESYENTTLFPRPQGAIEGKPDGDQWSVPEVDARILSGWFWTDGANENTLKSERRLAQMYFESVGRGAAFLLNMSPNKTGAVSEEQLNRFKQLGENIKGTFANDFTKAEGVTASATSVWGNAKAYSPANVLDEIPDGQEYDETYWAPAKGETTGSLEIDLGQARVFDVVSIEEYIQKGQTISSFSVEYKDTEGEWQLFDESATVSSKRLCRTAPVEGTAVRINIKSAYSTPMISNVGVFKAVRGFELDSAAIKVPSNLRELPIQDFTLDSSWSYQDAEMNAGASKEEAGSAWSNANKNGVASFTFTGTQAWIFGKKDPGHETADIKNDGKAAGIMDTWASAKSVGACLYVTPELEYGEHTVEITCTKDAIGLSKVQYADGTGIFDIKQKKYGLVYGATIEVEIIRQGGSKGEATIHYITESASAEQGVNYEHTAGSVTFADGETVKKVTLTAYDKNGIPAHDDRIVDGKDFYFTLLSGSQGAGISTEPSANVVLYNADSERILEECESINLDTYKRQTVAEFEKALAALKECRADSASTPEALRTAAKNLMDAKNALEKEDGNYTADNPFNFPSRSDTLKTVEAEAFELDFSKVSAEADRVRVAETEDGIVVENFKNGNRIKLPFYAAKRGIYTVTAFYRSDRTEDNPHTLNWGGTNVRDGSLDVYGETGVAENLAAEITVKVIAQGNGELIFTADEKDSPVIDKFRIKYAGEDPEVAAQEKALENLDIAVNRAKAFIDAGKGNYTETSWKAFTDAYHKAAKRDPNASVETIEALQKALEEAQKALKPETASPAPKPTPAVTALRAPAGVKAVSTSTGDVKVTFQASANAASYEIYRRIGNGAAKKIGTVTKPSYVDHKPAGGKKSTYTVVAVSSGAVYKNSAESKGASITLPKAVTKLKAKAAGKNVKISFKKVKGAKNYIIYRASQKNGKYKKVKMLKAKQTTFVDKKAKKGNNFYKVVVKKGKVYSPASKVRSVKIKK